MAENTTEEQTSKPEEDRTLRKYNVDLGDNRGSTVMKLTAKDAEKRGLSDADLVDGQEAPAADTKAKAASANKAKGASNK